MTLEADGRDIFRADYQPTEYRTESVELRFELDPTATQVRCVQRLVRREPLAPGTTGTLRLDGQHLKLCAVSVDGRALSNNEYALDDESLTVAGLPERFELTVDTELNPDANTRLEGLYRSSGMFCTQCEAEGFRTITYYQDRPDVLARFTTRIVANADEYPVLLSNGNLIADERLPDGRREVTWEDPFPKPSYLFALVGGDLASIEDRFVTLSGREVRLVIYSEPHNIEQCHYAMDALKRSMAWDEARYGREYDLDLFMIVAVDDFNMGAMENKGLNIFNTSCVLASPETATDAAYQRVEAVVAHEYFHNWSGNRVTCQDWFQLSLKEGFTVFRDAQFSAEMNGATAKRIEDVSFLRSTQFAEDAGPLAHPVRPESYQEISNFYTVTIYEKGAEVVRMLHTLLGADRFRQGTDLYFDKHDGQAATVEDFVSALEQANDLSLAQFRHWYSQAGTPQVEVAERWADGCLELELKQHLRELPATPAPVPQHIPIVLGLVGADGAAVDPSSLTLGGDLRSEAVAEPPGSLLVHLEPVAGKVTFSGLAQRPEVSLLRGFSAPVRVKYPRSPDRLAHLARYDVDGFARWDSLQTLLVDELLDAGAEPQRQTIILELFQDLVREALDADDAESLSQAADMLRLPSEAYLFEQASVIDVARLVHGRDQLLLALAGQFTDQWQALYDKNRSGAGSAPYTPAPDAMARRALAGLALGMLTRSPGVPATVVEDRLLAQLNTADNLTDRSVALACLVNAERASPTVVASALAEFYERCQREALVVNLWLQTQATAVRCGLSELRGLLAHPSYDARNPNKVRSVVGAFANGNARNFHAADGSGYAFLAEQVRAIDSANPQLAARLVQPLSRWQRYSAELQPLMRTALEGLISGTPNAESAVSKDLYEIVSKSL